jgi:hypothetical protein
MKIMMVTKNNVGTIKNNRLITYARIEPALYSHVPTTLTHCLPALNLAEIAGPHSDKATFLLLLPSGAALPFPG